MIKLMNAGLAALIAAGSMAAAATPAAAEGRWGHDGGWRGGDRWEHGGGGGDAEALIVGGIAGLALGAALSSHNQYQGQPNYRYGYGYGNGYGYGYDNPYRVCVERRTVWDPYYGDYVVRPVRYRC